MYVVLILFFFFFKQKTAYEMRISDWSSDVCSSDLMMEGLVAKLRAEIGRPTRTIATGGLAALFDEHTDIFDAIAPDLIIQGLALMHEQIGRASCRERVCQYV